MKTTDFQKLLFKSAVSAMAVDGVIHDIEIEEIKSIVKHNAYFLDFDFENELEENLTTIKKSGKDAINQYLVSLASSDMNQKQELILVDVLLRMMEADKHFDTAEIKFLQLVKSKLKTSEEVLISKFPRHIEYLMDLKGYDSASLFDSDILLK